MTYNFWQQDSQLTRALVPPQRTAYHHPWQSVDPSQCNNTAPAVTVRRTTSTEDTTTANYPHNNLSYQRPPPSKHLTLQIAERNIENAANRAPPGVSSGYPPYPSVYASTPSLGLSTICIDLPQMSSKQPFFHNTRHGSRFQEEPRSQCPVKVYRSEAHAFIGPTTCQWEDEQSLCNRTIDAKQIPEHMNTHHHFKQSPADPGSESKCKWRECRRLGSFRRDTIFRHIREVHLGMPRQKAHTC